jgi:hypothetical protein
MPGLLLTDGRLGDGHPGGLLTRRSNAAAAQNASETLTSQIVQGGGSPWVWSASSWIFPAS